jgi:heavy metal sensor kinase
VKPLTLRTTLSLSYAAILALLLAALGFSYYRLLARQLELDAAADLDEVTSGLHGYLHFGSGMPSLVYDRNDPEEVAFIEKATRYYQIYDANSGLLLLQSPALEPLGLHYVPAEVQAFRAGPRVHEMRTDQGRLKISSSVVAPNPGEAYLLQVGVSLDRADRALERFQRLLLWSVPLGLVAVVGAGRWMVGRALAPLVRLAEATRTISVTNLHQRLPVRGAGDELDEVSLAFNDLLARQEQAIGEMRQFSAALAHELRTPLAVLRGETELALRHPGSLDEQRRRMSSQLEEFDKLARLINRLLTLARAEAGEIHIAHARVDLAEVATSIVEQMEPVAEARQITLSCEAAGAVIVVGDAGWLERLLLILLDNAIKFTPERGRVSLQVAQETGTARLEVHDSGPGISPDAMPHLFERFYRADPARSRESEGAGLGLALARWIADAHQASIEVSSQPGTGSTFTVRLPLAPPDRTGHVATTYPDTNANQSSNLNHN